MPHVGGGAGKPLLPTLGKSEERRKQAASGWPFLWILSFGQTKESISAVGPRPDIKTSRRASDTYNTNLIGIIPETPNPARP
jgi:hypothetical protein